MLHLVKGRGLAGRLQIESAGTVASHVGEPADSRSAAAARKRGIDLPSRARQFQHADFERFDYVLAMDASNHDDLLALSAGSYDDKIHLLRDFDGASAKGSSVPDPYYGGARGFEVVLDQCVAACEGLLAHLTTRGEL